MIHRGLLFWSIAAVGTAIGLFSVKYKVQDLEEQIDRTNEKIIESQQATHILKIEWAHLNEAERIERLSKTYLKLEQAGINQVARLDTLNNFTSAKSDSPKADGKTDPSKPGTVKADATKPDQQRRDSPLPSPPRTGNDVPSSSVPGGGRVSAEAGSPSPASAPPPGRITTGSATPPQPAKPEPARKGPVGDGQVAATSIDEILSNKEGERR
jgi:cell division protein FtsL